MKEHAGINLIKIVKRSEFSNRALVLCSQFSRELKSLDGKGLVLQDEFLPQAIAKAMLRNHSDKLTALFEKLLIELQIDTENEDVTDRNSRDKKTESSLETNSDTKKPAQVKMYRGAPVVD